MNILQAVVRTMRQPDGSYRLPDGIRIEHAISPRQQPVWLVTFDRAGIDYWLSRELFWTSALGWDMHQDWAVDHGFATPEEAYFAWLQWTDGREEG